MKFLSIPKDMRALLSSGTYRVPRFQRPYSWGKGELEDFWTDAVVEGDNDYFIGSVVAYKIEPGLFGIVDGQQRMTTITMLLCAIRDKMAEEGFGPLAAGMHNLIERPSVSSDLPEYVLQPETSHPYFQEYIQSRTAPSCQVEMGEEEECLARAFAYLRDQVDGAVKGVAENTSITDRVRKGKIKKALEDLRDKLLGLTLILIELDDEDSAYLTFETLNARGKDLRLSDLVKNHLARNIKKSTKTVDSLKERWEQVFDLIDGSTARIRVDGFIHHHWLSSRSYVSEKSAYKEIKRTVGKGQASGYLDELVVESKVYRALFEPGYRKWSKDERPVKRALEALAVFRVVQPTPLLLSLVAAYDSKRIKLKGLIDAVTAVETFHFQFTAIAAMSSSGGMSKMYASIGQAIRKCKNTQDAAKEVRLLKRKLKERLPEPNEFDAGFVDLAYSNDFTRDRALVRYVLGRLARTGLRRGSMDCEELTIEHILSQSTSGADDALIARIGNLVFVSPETNGKLGTKSFSKKLAILKEAGEVWVDPALRKATNWTATEMASRAADLAKTGRTKIWRI